MYQAQLYDFNMAAPENCAYILLLWSGDAGKCSFEMPVRIYVPGFLPSSGVLTAASVYAKSPVLTSAVQLMVELCLFTGLGKRKRVMDEKELMMPLELGYVQAAEKRKALIKKFTSECVGSFCHSRDHIATHMATNVRQTLLL